MSKDRDEKVDGPRVAAQILNSMPEERKRALLQRIRSASPQVIGAIEANIISYEDIRELLDQGVQRLIKEADHRDLVLSMKKASQEVTEVLLRNMSQGKRKLVLEDLAAAVRVPVQDVDAAQKRIVQLMDRLRTQGIIHRQDGERYV